jgi:hypothetical protein
MSLVREGVTESSCGPIGPIVLHTPSKSKLTFTRQLESRHVYKKLSVTANINFGYNLSFSNGKLLELRPFLELSMYETSPSAITDWVERKGSLSQIKDWLSGTVETVMAVHRLLPTHSMSHIE